MKNFNSLASLLLAGAFLAGSAQFGLAAEKPKYGPAGHPYAAPLAMDHSYFLSPRHPAPDYWALSGFYVPQMNGASCSAASLATVLNAARATVPKSSEDHLILQPELVEKIKVQGWKERLSTEGLGPSHIHGVSLDALKDIAEAAFKAYGFPDVHVDLFRVTDVSAKTRAAVHRALAENEKSSRDFIVANFDQKEFTDDSTAGHIAPVGAYDAEKKRVLIMDPDREWYEPYWVSEERFTEAMRTKDSETANFRGFLVIHPGHLGKK